MFFHSLVEQKRKILQSDLIQGTTYTPLSFLGFGIPVICHFGSTNAGIISATPQTHRLEDENKEILHKLKADGVLDTLRLKTMQPLRDIAEVELYTALLSDAVIATSELVKEELASYGVPPEKVRVIHNAIEDYWFAKSPAPIAPPALVFLGRLGNDIFTWKLKGLDRVIALYKKFPSLPKVTLAASSNAKLPGWLTRHISRHTSHFNLPKEEIATTLHELRGSIVLLTSRYEGFSLSLIEAMSQGLIPLAYAVGVVPEIIEDGVNGYVVQSIVEAKAKVRLICKDEALRKRLSDGAIATASKFRGDVMAAELTAFYEEVLAKKHGESAILTAASERDKRQAGIDIEWAATTAEKVVEATEK